MLTDVQTFVAALDTMFGGFRERADADLRLLKDAGHGVPRGRRARAGRAARGVVLRRPARRGADAARRPGRSTGSSGRGARAERRAGAGGRRAAATRGPSGRRPPDRRRCCGCTPTRPDAAARHAAGADAFTAGAPAGCRWRRCRPRPRTSTTSRVCARSARPSRAELSAGRLEPSRRRAARPAVEACGLARRGGLEQARARSGCSGRRLSRARRSRSVMPPQTPNSVRLSRASARHSVMTGQPCRPSWRGCCAAPWTNSASGSMAAGTALGPVSSPAVCGSIRSLWLPIVTVTSLVPLCPDRAMTPEPCFCVHVERYENGHVGRP